MLIMLNTIIRKIKNLYHIGQAILANLIFGFPSKKITVIGVTGTDGKTTTVNLIFHCLKSLGKKVSMVSTIYAQIGEEIYDTGFHVTTPNSFTIQRFLCQSLKNGDEYFILETTSHALDQNRVWGVKFKIGVITNITHEHLDYHKTYQDYVKAKAQLLKQSEVGIINKNDQSYSLLLPLIEKFGLKVIFYNQVLPLVKKNFNLLNFNQNNYAAAFTVLKTLGFKEIDIINSMKDFKLPQGRFDIVYDKDFKIIIDFAHTPNAFLNLLKEVKKTVGKHGRIIHVFGSAGLRDQSKRSSMGKVSSLYSDYIILTEEDYRTEDPIKICQQIRQGFVKKIPYRIIVHRDEAISYAIKIAQKNDVILITGKGHEKSLCRGKKEYPWSDYQAVETSLKNLNLL